MKSLLQMSIVVALIGCAGGNPAELKKSGGGCTYSSNGKTFSSNLDYLTANADRYERFNEADKSDYNDRFDTLDEKELESYFRTLGEKQNYQGDAKTFRAGSWISAIVKGVLNTAGRAQREGIVSAAIGGVGEAITMVKGVSAGNPAGKKNGGKNGNGNFVGDVAPPIDHSGGMDNINGGLDDIAPDAGLDQAETFSSDAMQEQQFLVPLEGPEGC